jgi:hypothetical protein
MVMKRAGIFLFAFCFSTSLFAQGLFESASNVAGEQRDKTFQLNGYVRGSAFGAGDVYPITNAFGEVGMNIKLKASKFVMNSDLRFRSGYSFNQQTTEFEMKEAYAGISTTAFDLLLGEQIISWGRTDGFNPTNNITPNNYFFFSANPDDQKIPNFMLKANVRFSPKVDWEIIAIPIFRPSQYRYDLFSMGENISFVGAVLPEKVFENSSLASKLNVELAGFGFSASWFSGYDPFYGFNLNTVDFSTGRPVITYIPEFYRKNSFGIDFALPINSLIIRGEAAYNLIGNKDNKMYIPNSDLAYVLALEHRFAGIVAIVQYIGKYTLNFEELIVPTLSDPMNPMAQFQYANEMIWFESAAINRKIFKQSEELNHAVSLTLSKDFAYETVNAEITGYYDITTGEYLLRPKISWKIGDALTASAGYSYMQGPDKTMFGYASPIMNGAFIELKASF